MLPVDDDRTSGVIHGFFHLELWLWSSTKIVTSPYYQNTDVYPV